MRADEWLASASSQPSLLVAGVPTTLGSLGPSEAWRAPGAIRAALARFPGYDAEAGVDLRDLPVFDVGDWDVAGLDQDDAPVVVERHAREVANGPTACFIGGDAMMLGPLVVGLARGDLDGVGLLVIGPHHASPPSAGAELGSAVGDLVRRGLPPGLIVQVGVSAFAGAVAAREAGVEVVTMDAVDEVGAGWVVTSALNDLADGCAWVVVGVDLAALDAAFAPGCRSARPGGMTPRQLAAASRAAGAHPSVRAVDLVGVDPALDPSGLTVMNGATVLLAFAAGLALREVR
jgi:formiminoglutamase